MSRLRAVVASGVLIGACAIAGQANAAPFDLSYSGIDNGQPTSTLLRLDVPASGSVAMFLSGTRNGVQVTGLSDYAQADNVLFLTQPYVTLSGISFTIVGGEAFNFYFSSDNTLRYYEINSIDFPEDLAPDLTPLDTVSVTPVVVNTAVPESATWATMLTGFALVGFALRRARTLSRPHGHHTLNRNSSTSPSWTT